jgi:hypothetical protein
VSITWVGFWCANGTVVVTATGETCFYCGRALADPAITWHGETGDIWMHPGCAVDLTIRLHSDLHDYQRATGHRFGDLGRSADGSS